MKILESTLILYLTEIALAFLISPFIYFPLWGLESLTGLPHVTLIHAFCIVMILSLTRRYVTKGF